MRPQTEGNSDLGRRPRPSGLTERQLASLACGRLAKPSADLIQLLEVAKCNPDIATLACMADCNSSAQDKAELALQCQRVSVVAGRLRSCAGGFSRVFSQPLNVSDGQVLRDDAIGDLVWMRDREQGSGVPR